MPRRLDPVTRAVRDAVRPHARVLVAVSGGIDSVALLHASVSLRDLFHLTVEIAHLDHALRPTSGNDARFVSELARHYGCPVHLSLADQPPVGSNIEAWARDLRYSFFLRVVKTRSLDYVLTAHHANDVAETLLMKLLYHKELASIEAWDPVRRCLRPLLDVSRREIVEYGAVHGLSWVDDETNTDTARLRNKIRHQVLPWFEREFYDGVTHALSRKARELAEDQDLLTSLGRARAESVMRLPFGSREWMTELYAVLEAETSALRWRVVESVLFPVLGFPLGRRHALRVVSFLLSNGAQIEIPGRCSLHRKGGGLEVRRTPARVEGGVW
jgi:tRNA(Ile)-lysidine synthase